MGYSKGHRLDLGGQLWKYRLYRLATQWKLTPLIGALLYLVFGFAALFFSDVVFPRYFSEPVLSQVQALKGSVEVVLTGGLVFVLLRASRYPLEHANKKLERRQEELQVLHRVLRHNLRNDINIIRGFTDLLEQDLSADAREECSKIRQATTEILDYAQQASRIRRVTEQNGTISTSDLAETIPSLLDQHALIDERVDISLDLPKRAVVEVNHMFEPAIEELITNAITHAEEESPELSISVHTESGVRGMTEVCVADNGPGIPPHVAERLGRPEGDQINHLDGLGLWFVYWTVSESKGTLEIEASELGGSRVRMWVPEQIPLSIEPS